MKLVALSIVLLALALVGAAFVLASGGEEGCKARTDYGCVDSFDFDK